MTQRAGGRGECGYTGRPARGAERRRGLGACVAVLLWSLLGAVPSTAAAADEAAPRVSVLTFGPGAIYWQRFGHNAMLVRDGNRTTVYNYGYLDFQQENFLRNFVRGRMLYFLATDGLPRTLAQYQHEGREVIEQELDLAPDQARRLAEFLAWNAQPENAPYRYDYYRAGCSTKLRDALDMATDGALQFMHARPARLNYREQTVRLTAPDLPLMLALDFLLGPRADLPRTLWEESFVPEVLAAALREATRLDEDGEAVPLLRDERQLIPPAAERLAETPPETPPDLRLAFFIAGLVWAVLLLMAAQWSRPLWGVLAGFQLTAASIGGLVLVFMTVATAHWAGHFNLSVLAWNPLALLALGAVWSGARGRVPGAFSRGIVLVLPVCAVVGLAGVLWQDSLHQVLFWLPAHAALAYCVHRGAAGAAVAAGR